MQKKKKKTHKDVINKMWAYRRTNTYIFVAAVVVALAKIINYLEKQRQRNGERERKKRRNKINLLKIIMQHYLRPL